MSDFIRNITILDKNIRQLSSDNSISSNNIEDGSITESKLANNSVTSDKIDNESINDEKVGLMGISLNSVKGINYYPPTLNSIAVLNKWNVFSDQQSINNIDLDIFVEFYYSGNEIKIDELRYNLSPRYGLDYGFLYRSLGRTQLTFRAESSSIVTTNLLDGVDDGELLTEREESDYKVMKYTGNQKDITAGFYHMIIRTNNIHHKLLQDTPDIDPTYIKYWYLFLNVNLYNEDNYVGSFSIGDVNWTMTNSCVSVRN